MPDRPHLPRPAPRHGDRRAPPAPRPASRRTSASRTTSWSASACSSSNSGAAVVVLVRRSTPDKVLPRISQFGGDGDPVLARSRRSESELQAALGGQARGRLSCAEALAAHLGSRQVARVIYGAIIGLALLVVLEQHPPSRRRRSSRRCVATALAVGLAELYSEIVGTETRTRHRSSRGELADVRRRRAGRRLRHQLPGGVLRARGARRRSSTDTAFTDRALERARPDRLLRLGGRAAGRRSDPPPAWCRRSRWRHSAAC